MRIAAFDIASNCGVVWGAATANARPVITSWRLRKTGRPPEEAAANFGCLLRDLFSVESFDLIAVENYMNPAAQPSADAAIFGIMLRGALESVAGCYGVPVKDADASTIRKHFCGQATAVPPRRRNDPPRSAKQKAADRLKTKEMVWKRAVALGYFDRGEAPDFDKSDAVAVWDHAVATYARAARPLALFAGA